MEQIPQSSEKSVAEAGRESIPTYEDSAKAPAISDDFKANLALRQLAQILLEIAQSEKGGDAIEVTPEKKNIG